MFSSSSIFHKPFESQATVAPSVVVTPWYLLGGVTAAQCAAAYQPKGAASLAASKVNLNNPGTYDAAAGVDPTFAAATGWTFNGSSQYLISGVTPALTYTFLLRYANASGNTGQHGSGYFYVSPRYYGNRGYGNGGGTLSSVGAAAVSGVIGMASKAAYHNGASDGTIGAGTSAPTVAICIGARSGPTTYCTTDVLAVAIYNITLNSTQIGLITTAMAAL